MPIEQVSPELERIVSLDQPIEELASGFGNDNGPAEGPVWWKEGGYLLFSDIGNNRRMKWAPGEGASVFHEPTNYANGLTRGHAERAGAGLRLGQAGGGGRGNRYRGHSPPRLDPLNREAVRIAVRVACLAAMAGMEIAYKCRIGATVILNRHGYTFLD